MTTDIRFVKLAGRWYAFLPDYDEGDVNNLEMVGGANLFLELLHGMKREHNGIITLNVSDNTDIQTDIELTSSNDGAEFDGEMGMTYKMIDRTGKVGNMDIWLCPVCKWFFKGIYPNKMYIKLI